MFALLFDRRSLAVTGLSLAGAGVLLFAAGLVTGMTLRQERELVPPYWLQYGPVEPADVRLDNDGTGAGGSATASTAGGAIPWTASGEGAAGTTGTAGGTLSADSPTAPADDWAPFAAPGDPARESGAATPGTKEGTPPTSAIRATPPGGVSAPPATTEPAGGPPGAKTEPDRGLLPSGKEPSGQGSNGKVRSTVPRAAPVTEPSATLAECRPGGAWYVQTGAYAVAANARAEGATLETRFANAGYRPYLRPTTASSGRHLTLVRIGPFPSRTEAQQAAAGVEGAMVGREARGASVGCGGGENGGTVESGPAKGIPTAVLVDSTGAASAPADDLNTALISPVGSPGR